jgi:putative methylase
MRLRDLEQALQRVRPFDTTLQKIDLEQFPTGFHIASQLVLAAAENDDIEGCVVADLGTGTGMLGIGCALMGASAVVGLDADLDALVIAAENIEAADVEEVMDLVQCDVSSMPLRPTGLPTIDTVLCSFVAV